MVRKNLFQQMWKGVMGDLKSLSFSQHISHIKTLLNNNQNFLSKFFSFTEGKREKKMEK